MDVTHAPQTSLQMNDLEVQEENAGDVDPLTNDNNGRNR